MAKFTIRCFLKIVFLFFGLLYLVNCSTFSGRRQLVKISSDLDYTELFEDSRYLGRTPGFFELTRSSSKSLLLTRGQRQKSLQLEAKPRWNTLVTGNSLAGLIIGWQFIPVLIFFDLGIGSGWEYQEPEVVRFLENKQPIPLEPVSIAIAPPRYSSDLVSEEIGIELEKLMIRRFPNSKILAYPDSLTTFSFYNYSPSSQVSPEYQNKLYYQLGTTHLAESQVIKVQDHYRVNTQLLDIFRNEVVDEVSGEVNTRELSANQNSPFGIKSLISDFLPNAIGIERVFSSPFLSGGFASTSDIDTVPRYYTINLEESEVSGLRLSASNLISSQLREKIQFHFRILPKANFEYRKAHIDERDYSGSTSTNRQYNLSYYHLGMGAGLELGLDTSLGYFFTGLYGQLSSYWLKYQSEVSDGEFQQWSLDPSYEIGNSFFITQRISFKTYVQVTSFPTNFWEKTVNLATTSSNATVSQGTYTFLGLAIEYFFPEARYKVRSTLRNL